MGANAYCVLRIRRQAVGANAYCVLCVLDDGLWVRLRKYFVVRIRIADPYCVSVYCVLCIRIAYPYQVLYTQYHSCPLRITHLGYGCECVLRIAYLG